MELPDSFVALVHPRTPDEELFPEDIDKTLSSFELHLVRISLPTGYSSMKVRDRSFDRIQVRVEGEIPSADDAKHPETHEKFEEVAIRACNIFLGHCRVVAQSPFVNGIEREYRLEDGRYYVVTPRTVSWFSGEDGQRLPAYQGDVNASATSGAIPSPERGWASMHAIVGSMARDVEPNLPSSLLVEAEGQVRTVRLREAIIGLGTACEVASDQYIEANGRTRDPAVEAVLERPRTSFAAKRFHLVTELISGRSLKREDRATFDVIEDTYRIRNSLAHKGQLGYKKSGTWVAVDQALATQFLSECRSAVAWLMSL